MFLRPILKDGILAMDYLPSHPLAKILLSCSLQIPMKRCVIVVIFVCWGLLATPATVQERTRYGYPKGFNRDKKYLMKGKHIILTEKQECRVHCTKEYFTCFEGKRCHMKQNKHLIEECKEEYNECMRRCLRMLERIENDDFPPPRNTVDTTD